MTSGRNPGQRPGQHAWERWAMGWHVVFAVVLVAGVVGALRGGSDPLIVAILSLALGSWYLWWNVLRSPSTPPGQALAHVGSLLLWLALIWVHVAFVPVGAFLAAHVCYLSLAWAVPVGIGFVGGVVLRGLVVDGGIAPRLVVPLAGAAGFGILLAAYVTAIARESRGRAALIEELEATRDLVAEAERRRGVLEERQRLARDVHDTLAQAFTSIIVQLRAADVTTEETVRDGHVGRAMSAASEGLAQARRVVWDLSEEAPDDLDLALRDLIEGHGRHGGTAVARDVSGTPVPVPPKVRHELLLIAREALTNADRHARAARATVTLRYDDGAIGLVVRDDGRGFDPASTNGGFGLRTMRERARLLGGTLTVDTAPGRGTTLVVEVPTT